MNTKDRLIQILKELHLPDVRKSYESVAAQAQKEHLSYEEFLLELLELECSSRKARKIERYQKESKLPLQKRFDTFELKRLNRKLMQQVKVLQTGDFTDNNENVLAFGNPGSGKSHLLCALCHEMIENGKRVYFNTCDLLVQDLLVCKRDLKLSRKLKSLDKFDVIMIDDIGYVQRNREEMEVLFTFLAHRYERGSLMITSNLPFSKWESIFKDPMTTAAAIDRIVHHSVILEMNIPSYRTKGNGGE